MIHFINWSHLCVRFSFFLFCEVHQSSQREVQGDDNPEDVSHFAMNTVHLRLGSRKHKCKEEKIKGQPQV